MMKVNPLTCTLMLLAIFGIYACSPKKESTMTALSEQQKKNIELIHQLYAYFNQHDWKQMAEMYVDTADFKDPSLGEGIVKQTRKETETKYAQLNEYFPDIRDEVIQVYPSGAEHVIVEFVSTGTGPDQSKFQLPICTIFTIVNGKITSDYTYYDNFEE